MDELLIIIRFSSLHLIAIAAWCVSVCMCVRASFLFWILSVCCIFNASLSLSICLSHSFFMLIIQIQIFNQNSLRYTFFVANATTKTTKTTTAATAYTNYDKKVLPQLNGVKGFIDIIPITIIRCMQWNETLSSIFQLINRIFKMWQSLRSPKKMVFFYI